MCSGTNREWRIAVVGIGNLGSALLMYKDFLKQSYKIVAAFDQDPAKAGLFFQSSTSSLPRSEI